jgi:hypothetical protein
MRLNLYRFDGSPLPVMYLVSKTPEMLPTRPLHQQSTLAAHATPIPTRLGRRSFPIGSPLKKDIDLASIPLLLLDPDAWWWFGILIATLGGFLYLFI